MISGLNIWKFAEGNLCETCDKYSFETKEIWYRKVNVLF